MGSKRFHWVKLEIRNWQKYNPADNGRKRTWFRLDNDLVQDTKFNSMPVSARCFYFYLLSVASAQSSGVLSINLALSFATLNLLGARSKDLLRALVDNSYITILAESFTSSAASMSPTNERTNERTNVHSNDAESSNSNQETNSGGESSTGQQPTNKTGVGSSPEFLHPVEAQEIRMTEGFQKLMTFLAENKCDSPRLKRQAPEIYKAFGSFDAFDRWVGTFLTSKFYKRAKSQDDKINAFTAAILTECGLARKATGGDL
jgi:Ni/Co efflux regulator RcnB